MIKKTLTYQDYNGNTVTNDHYFNLNKVEILKLEATYPGGYAHYLEEIGKTNNPLQIIETLEDIVRKSYGKKSEDGIRFIKSKEITDAFLESNAYVALIEDFLTNPEQAAGFMSGIITQ